MSTQLNTREESGQRVARQTDSGSAQALPSGLRKVARGFRAGKANALSRRQAKPVETLALLGDVKECLDVLDLRFVEQGRSFANRFNEILARTKETQLETQHSIRTMESRIQKFHESFIKHKHESSLLHRELSVNISRVLENEGHNQKRIEQKLNERLDNFERKIASLRKPLDRQLQLLEAQASAPAQVAAPHLSLVDSDNIQDFIRKEEQAPAVEPKANLHQNIFFGLVIFLQLSVSGMLVWMLMTRSPY